MNFNEYCLYQENIQQHLKDRGVDTNKVGVWIDKEGNTASFPLYNLSGQLVGYQFYNPDGPKKTRIQSGFDKKLMKYYTYIAGESFEKKLGVWGLETYNISTPFLFIIEGIFDAVKIHNAGYPAIAVLSNNPTPMIKSWLKTLPQKIIAILDNDANNSGNKLKSSAHKSFIVPDPYKDLGDMPQEEASKFIENIIKTL
jgi:phage/plasmid primase-like uncharacterized protein